MKKSFVTLVLAALAMGAMACGHPATEDECRVLFDKSVEVEMREYVGANDDAIAKKQAELRKEFEGDLGRCVGKRVTEGSIECIRKASNKAELNECRWNVL